MPAPDGYPIKLVRDGTPQILNASGEPGDLFYSTDGRASAERWRWLKLKLSEEVGEYLVDGGSDELVDVIAVIDALASAHGCSLAELVDRFESSERGGFRHGVMMYGRHEEFDGQ